MKCLAVFAFVSAAALTLSACGFFCDDLACGDKVDLELDRSNVTCSEDLECAVTCEEGDAATCIDGLCDDCTRITVPCTTEGPECADGCEEGDYATCNADLLTCDGCTPRDASGE